MAKLGPLSRSRMKKQQPEDTQKKELEDLLSKSAVLRQQHQETSVRMDEIRKQTEEFLKGDADEADQEP